MLQAHRSAASWRTALWIALPAAAAATALVVHYWGCWDRLGWATPNQLQEGLQSVREAVSAAAVELGESMRTHFTRVETQLTETAHHVQQVREELKAEVRTVGESVVALEQRMAPIEADVHRSATG